MMAGADRRARARPDRRGACASSCSTGAGDHFCGGADIVARNAGGRRRAARVPAASSAGCRRRRTASSRCCSTVQVPVVCKVRGWAAGIGFQLALAADFTRRGRRRARSGSRSASAASRPTAARPGCCRAASARSGRASCCCSGASSAGAEAAEWGADPPRRAGEPSSTARSTTLVAQLATGPTVALGLTKWLLHTGAAPTLDAAPRERGVRARAVVAHRRLPRGPRRVPREARRREFEGR